MDGCRCQERFVWVLVRVGVLVGSPTLLVLGRSFTAGSTDGEEI